jgi:hypothetical protein
MLCDWHCDPDGFSSNRRVPLSAPIVSITLTSAAAFVRFCLSRFTQLIYKQTNNIPDENEFH